MSTNIGVNTEMLITAVKDRPCLWNKFHGDYKDRNKSSQAWKEVCYELMEGFDYLPDVERNLFGKEVLKRWNNIRDSFRKYIKQVEKEIQSGKSGSKTRKYVYTEQLQFLGNMFNCKSLENSFHPSPSNHSHCEDDDTTPQYLDPLAIISPIPSKKIKLEIDDQKEVVDPLDQNDSSHLSFCKGFLPMVQDFNEEETIDFQLGVLNLIRDIRQRRSKPESPSSSDNIW